MPISWDRYRALETEALASATQAEAEQGQQAPATAPETQAEEKPDGYYANCSPEERQAELRRLGIHTHGHGLAG